MGKRGQFWVGIFTIAVILSMNANGIIVQKSVPIQILDENTFFLQE